MNKTILRLAIPNILSNISVPLLGMVDTALMGRMESEAYLSAIALGGILFSFIYWGLGFIRMGTTGMTAQAYGAKNPEEGIAVLGRALLVGGFFSVLLLVLQYPLGELGFRLLEGEASGENQELVKQLAREYFYIRIWAAPANLASFALTGWFLGMQNARFPMTMTIAVNVFNIGFNFLFIYEFGMKSDGVALATVIAQYLGVLLGLALFYWKYRNQLRHLNRQIVFQLDSLRHFFTVNTDIFIRTVLLVFSLAFVNAKSFALDALTLAANAILLQYFYTMSYAVDGFAYAAESLAGRYVGAKQADRLKQSISLLHLWGIGIGGVFALVYALLGEELLLVFTNQAEIIETAQPYLWWMVLIAILSPAAFIWDGVYIGATATKAMRNTMMVAVLLLFLPAYYLTIGPWGNHGIWFAMAVLMLARGGLLTLTARKHVFRLAA
jgi:MATE family multidrug resistance protein